MEILYRIICHFVKDLCEIQGHLEAEILKNIKKAAVPCKREQLLFGLPGF